MISLGPEKKSDHVKSSVFDAKRRKSLKILKTLAELSGKLNRETVANALVEAIMLDSSLEIARVKLFSLLDYVTLPEGTQADAAAFLSSLLPGHLSELPVSCSTVMAEIRRFSEAMTQTRLPDYFSISPHWEKALKTVRELVIMMEDPRHIVLMAQRPGAGFDSRQVDPDRVSAAIELDRQALLQVFGSDPLQCEALWESMFSVRQSLTFYSGQPFSTSSLWHGSFYLRVTSKIAKSSMKILEIGGGYGGLARLFLRSGAASRYYMVDLADTLIYAHAFLRLNFPDRSCALIGSEEEWNRNQDAEIVLLPLQHLDLIIGQEFDLTINTGSLQEMPSRSASFIMYFVQEKIKTEYFYSMNYIFENRNILPETIQESQGEVNNVAPILDKFWDVSFFQINPPQFLSNSRRNWLEVLLRRTDRPATFRNPADGHFASQGWFEVIWLELWKNPSAELIDRYIEAISALFADQATVKLNPRRIGSSGKAMDIDEIGEVIYWRKIKQGLTPRSRHPISAA